MQPANFLQSDQWAKFQNDLGRPTYRLGGVLVIEHPIKWRKCFFYLPRADLNSELLIALKDLSIKRQAIFLRWEPLRDFVLPKGFVRAKPIQPENTLLLDLRPSEEELLAQMKPKTRYNIKVAQRHKVKIIESQDPQDIDQFYRLADLTAKRDQFNYFPKNYYQQMLKSFKGSLTLFLAEYDKKIISAAMMFYFKGTGFYLHGASDYQYRSLMAPYLIQWEGIRQAKKQGCLVYDFWGIAPRIKKEIPPPSESEEQGNGYQESDFDPQHPLIGVTRFKIGFAPKGEIIAYPGCWELPYQKLWYNLYRIAKRFLYSRG